MKVEKQINEAMEKGAIVIGTDRTLKELKNGKISTVILASNTPEDIKAELIHTASIANARVIEFEGDSKELGALCRKPFFIAVVGIKRKK